MATSQKPIAEAEIELRPDGWDRFEKAVDAAVKTQARRRDRRETKRTPSRRNEQICLIGRADEFVDALSALRSELDRHIEFFGAHESARQLILNALDRPEELVCIKVEMHSARANNLTVCFEPSERFGVLLAALRAGNVDRLIVKESRHS